MNKLESALVLRLRNTIRWDSAIDASPQTTVSQDGILHSVDGTQTFNPTDYQYRDRQLAYLDLINAAAVVEVSVEISDVWNATADQLRLQGPASPAFPAPVAEQTTTPGLSSKVRHVGNTSIIYDAARYTDNDLYTRDRVLYDVLAAACQTFTNPPIAPVNTPVTGVTAWSLAEGVDKHVSVNAALPLAQDLFGLPDRALADRDNLLAAHVARLVQAVQNPFSYANRLYVQVSQVGAREPEVYVLSSVVGTKRTWVADPALTGRNRIVYDTAAKTLAWTAESNVEIHAPQIVALSIPGLVADQTLNTVAKVPEAKDAQFWRQKAARIVPEGTRQTDVLTMPFTATENAHDGYRQLDCASLTVAGSLGLSLTGSLDAGVHRAAVLVIPNPVVEIDGASNTTGAADANGGVTFDIDVPPSGPIKSQRYLVEGGAGIVYNGENYYNGETFDGFAAASSYTRIAGTPSKVRQYSLAWKLALPPGAWKLTIDYTNLQHTTAGFGVGADYASNGNALVEVIKDTTALPFSGANGDILSSPAGTFDVVNGQEFTLPIYWSYGTGQLHVRKLTFENTDVTDCSIRMDGTIGTAEAAVSVVGTRYQPEVLLFLVSNGAVSPVDLKLNLHGSVDNRFMLPLQVKQVCIQKLDDYTPTPAAQAFQGWRQECLDRSERALAQTYNTSVRSYGTNFPVFYNNGTRWTWRNTEDWMSLVETAHPRVREIASVGSGAIAKDRQYEVLTGPVTYDGDSYAVGATFYGLEGVTTFSGGTVKQVGAFIKSNPGHLGKPCLIPNGLEFNGQHVVLSSYGTQAVPVVVSCQPWMIDAGVYTAHPDFWMPSQR